MKTIKYTLSFNYDILQPLPTFAQSYITEGPPSDISVHYPYIGQRVANRNMSYIELSKKKKKKIAPRANWLIMSIYSDSLFSQRSVNLP